MNATHTVTMPGVAPSASDRKRDETPFTYVSHAGGHPSWVDWKAPFLQVKRVDGRGSTWRITWVEGLPRLAWQGPRAEDFVDTDLVAALEAMFQLLPKQRALLVTELPGPAPGWMLRQGSALPHPQGLVVSRAAFWQAPSPWLGDEPLAFALQYELTQGRRHPARPPKPAGLVYHRYIPWLGQLFSLRTVDIGQDLSAFNRWMNEPAVARFWQEEGDLPKHRAYLERIQADAHTTALIGCLDDHPFSYFETYWAKEDRIAPFCDAGDHDRGWHVLVGEPAYRGQRYLTAWMPAISHYLFLDDPRTQRLVIEPRADNDRMIRSLSRCGYACIKEFDFPHKRAMLGVLLRERFFDEAIWNPKPDLGAS